MDKAWIKYVRISNNSKYLIMKWFANIPARYLGLNLAFHRVVTFFKHYNYQMHDHRSKWMQICFKPNQGGRLFVQVRYFYLWNFFFSKCDIWCILKWSLHKYGVFYTRSAMTINFKARFLFWSGDSNSWSEDKENR